MPALLHRHTRYVFALFFEDASHFHQTHKVIKHIQKHRHPQKSNYHKSVFFFFLILTNTNCQTERSRGRLAKKRKPHPCSPLPIEHPLKPQFTRKFGVNIFTKKRIKKKPKVCSGYSKKQVQAFGSG